MASITVSRSPGFLSLSSRVAAVSTGNGSKRWSSTTVKRDRNAKRYSINYQTLKDSGFFGSGASKASDLVGKSAPSTVAGNVKNVQGFKGGAERGFLGVYPDCIHQVVNSGPRMLQEWITKVLTHNLSTNVLGDTRFGLITPITFYQLSSSPKKSLEVANMTKETMKEAHIVGWSVELIRASQIVAAETLKFRGHRNILSTVTVEPSNTWAEKHDLGNRAFNDCLILQNGAFSLLNANISKHPSYGSILSSFGDALVSTSTGRAMTLRIDNLPSQSAKMQQLDVSTYKRIIAHNLTFPRYVLPMRLALHLAGLNGEKVHDQAYKVLNDVGFLAEMTGDFADCYYDETGTDIQDGRMTWLLVNAYHRGNANQKAALEANYGTEDMEKAAIVKQVYDDLKLKKMVSKDIDQSREELIGNIQHISALSKDTLSSKFFFNLLDNMGNMA